MSQEVEENVKNYYGKVLKTNKDLKTNACSFNNSMPKNIQEILNLVHPEVREKFYGCGLIIPESIEGARILDLGSGSGRDSFILSALAGNKGKVVGIDMTKEQVDVAKKYKKYHEDLFGLILINPFNSSEPSFNCSLIKISFEVFISNT